MSYSLAKPLLAVLLCTICSGWTSTSTAQLPSLGDPAGAELSPAVERKLGDAIMREIRRDPDYLPDPVLTDYLVKLMSQLGERAGKYSDQTAALDVFLVRDKYINAFALPGGYIGIHSALISNARSESELASVMAHEAAHVLQRHIARNIAKQKEQSLISLGTTILAALVVSRNPDAAQAAMTLGQAAGIQGQLNFSRDMEREADRIGLSLLTEAGFSPPAMLQFFKTLQAATRLADGGQFPYLRSHPLTTERIADVQQRISTLDTVPALPLMARTSDSVAMGKTALRSNDNAEEFSLMAARAKVLSQNNVDGWKAVRVSCRAGDSGLSAAGALYCDSFASLRMREFSDAKKALAALLLRSQQPRDALRAATLLQAEVEVATGDESAAYARLVQLLEREPLNRAVQLQLGDAALAARGTALGEARERLVGWTTQRRDDAQAWQLLGKLHAEMGQQSQALRSTAESHIAVQQWPLAISLLEQARTFARGDYFESSIVDARLREARTKQREELDEQKGARKPF
jgi:beta-barrel assembly-enhancing protease